MKHGEKTRKRILEAGVKLWPVCTAHAIGREICLTHSAVLYHFPTVNDLRDAIAKHAVETEASRVIMQLIAVQHPAIAGMSSSTKQRHVDAAQI